MTPALLSVPSYADGVFLNVPFDRQYQKLFHALVFTIHDCGFIARCALESNDGSQGRLDKLYTIISECRLGIHDLSRTSLDTANRLPRFNMPLELGIFLGAKRFGKGRERTKSALILERDHYRYQKYCSDIAGQDIRAHHNVVSEAIIVARDWLRGARQRGIRIPGGERIVERYAEFRVELGAMCRDRGLNPARLTFPDYTTLTVGWLDAIPGRGREDFESHRGCSPLQPSEAWPPG